MRTKLTVLGNQRDWANLYPTPLTAPKLQELQRERQGVNASGKFPLISNASCPRHLWLPKCSHSEFSLQVTVGCGFLVFKAFMIQLQYFLQRKLPGGIQYLYLQHLLSKAE